MKKAVLQSRSLAYFLFAVMSFVTFPAFAGAPIPAPLAGAFGPLGLLLAVAVYIGYRVITHSKK